VLARNPAPDLEARGVRVICASIDNAEVVHRACAAWKRFSTWPRKVGVWGDYESYFDANVLGTRAVLYGCRSHHVSKLVYTSTPQRRL